MPKQVMLLQPQSFCLPRVTNLSSLLLASANFQPEYSQGILLSLPLAAVQKYSGLGFLLKTWSLNVCMCLYTCIYKYLHAYTYIHMTCSVQENTVHKPQRLQPASIVVLKLL